MAHDDAVLSDMTSPRDAAQRDMANLMPSAYRQVSVASVGVDLTLVALRRYFLGRECYRRTRYIVARRGVETALIEVELSDVSALFSPAVEVTLLASSDETVFVGDPQIDTGVASQMAKVADAHGGVRCIVVEGRYSHVSFLLDPAPIRIRVREVVPPMPAKLLEQAQRLLDVAEDLPPTLLLPELVEFSSMAPAQGDVLVPCRGAGIEMATGTTFYLDERPADHDWTLLGCARSREIHRWFYGRSAPSVDMCPRVLGTGGDGLLLTKCCLLEADIELGDDTAVVPWGASLEQVRAALVALISMAGAPCRPA